MTKAEALAAVDRHIAKAKREHQEAVTNACQSGDEGEMLKVSELGGRLYRLLTLRDSAEAELDG